MAEETLPGPGVLDVWVLQGEEEPLEPLLPIVDPHHHLRHHRVLDPRHQRRRLIHH